MQLSIVGFRRPHFSAPDLSGDGGGKHKQQRTGGPLEVEEFSQEIYEWYWKMNTQEPAQRISA